MQKQMKLFIHPTDLNVDKVYIDLTGEEKGKYTLEIQLPKEAFTGDFELE